jgi:hypothetical protein
MVASIAEAKLWWRTAVSDALAPAAVVVVVVVVVVVHVDVACR